MSTVKTLPLPLLKPGLHPDASAAFRKIGITADRIMQTIGTAPASDGAHKADGLAGGKAYAAPTDLRTRDLTRSQIRAELSKLADVGFAAFARIPGEDHWPAGDAPHIHAVFAGCPMKEMLRRQIHDWLHGRNGLASHVEYHFWQPTEAEKQIIRAKFLAHNPADG